ncbi:MAG TPA: YihY/virulence factor BrkB family protein [Gemmatimonadaceae bacterium]
MDARGVLKVVSRTFKLWTGQRAFQHAAALSYYTLFSMAPLLIILIAIAGAVFGERAVSGEITEQISDTIGPQAAEAVSAAIEQSRVQEAGLLPALLGIGALLFGATTVFGQMQISLNQFWGVRARPSRSGIVVFLWSRLVSLGVVIIIGFLLLVSFALSVAVGAMLQFAGEMIPIPSPVVAAINAVVSLVIATLMFAVIFKVLPDVRLQWRDLWLGAFVTAVLFVVGQALISLYLTRTATASTYGAAGSLVLVLLWVYYSALILFLGASFTRAWVQQRGAIIPPKRTAVKVRTETVEEGERMVASGPED